MGSIVQSLNLGYQRLVLERPWIIIVLWLGVLLALGSGMQNWRFSTDYRVFFSDDNPQMKAFQVLEERFAQRESTIIAVEARIGDLFTPEALTALRELTASGWHLCYSSRSASLTSYQHSYAQGDDIIAEPLIPVRGTITQAMADRARNIALNETSLLNYLLSPDGKVAGMTIRHTLPRADIPPPPLRAGEQADDCPRMNAEAIAKDNGQTVRQQAINKVAGQVYAMLDDIERRYPMLKTHATGVVQLNQSFLESMQWDSRYLFPVAIGSIFLGLMLFFRNIWASGATGLITLVATVSAFGIGLYSGITITTASLSAALIILTLGVADCVHIISNYYHELAVNGQAGQSASATAKRDAMAESLRINQSPVMVTSLTTAIGFLCMNFSDAPPYQDLGNIVAMGVLMAWLASISLLPAVMVMLPAKVRSRRDLSDVMERFADWIVLRQRQLLGATLLVILALTALIPLNRFDDNYVKYFSEQMRFRQDTQFINDHLAGMQLLQYTVDSGRSNGAYDPAFLGHVDNLMAWFEKQPEVTKALSITTLFKKLNRTFNQNDPDYYRLPDSAAASAQFLIFYETTLPSGVDINHDLDIDRRSLKLTILLDSIPGHQLLQVEQRARKWMAANWPAHMQAEASGTPVIFANIADRNFRSMVLGIGVALGLISLLLIGALRSVKVGLLSLIPNLVPGLMAFGFWGATNGALDMSLSVVGSLTLGIVVDDTVHLLSKYLRARRELGLEVADAIRYAFRMVGGALVTTSAVLVVGLSILAMSSFTLTGNLGTLAAVTIVMALFCDFLFLPPLLLRLSGKLKV